MINLADFLAAVKHLERKIPDDPDLVQDVALFAWEHLDECRSNLVGRLLVLAWDRRRSIRRDLAREIDAMAAYVHAPRALRTEPEQEAAVFLREIAMMPDAAPLGRAGATPMQVSRARAKVEQFAFAAA